MICWLWDKEWRGTVGDCRCGLSLFNSKFHTAVFNLFRCQQSKMLGVKCCCCKARSLSGAGVEAGNAHCSPAGMCHTDTDRQTDIQSKEWEFTPQHGEEFRDGQGERLEEQRCKGPPLISSLPWSAWRAMADVPSSEALSHSEEGSQPFPPGLSNALCDPRDHFS